MNMLFLKRLEFSKNSILHPYFFKINNNIIQTFSFNESYIKMNIEQTK